MIHLSNLSLRQKCLESLNLLHHRPSTSTPRRIPPLHTRLKVENILDIRVERRTDRLELLQSEVGQGDFVLLGQTDARARNVVGLSERNL